MFFNSSIEQTKRVKYLLKNPIQHKVKLKTLLSVKKAMILIAYCSQKPDECWHQNYPEESATAITPFDAPMKW
uniref:Uncharacterized protein n=1 Tax=Romanomermis culicivorax TaxID=13658 RepID=A0A915HPS6_ROMCU